MKQIRFIEKDDTRTHIVTQLLGSWRSDTSHILHDLELRIWLNIPLCIWCMQYANTYACTCTQCTQYTHSHTCAQTHTHTNTCAHIHIHTKLLAIIINVENIHHKTCFNLNNNSNNVYIYHNPIFFKTAQDWNGVSRSWLMLKRTVRKYGLVM